MQSKLILALDLGTQSARASLIDDHGNIKALSKVKYNPLYLTDENGVCEQHPDVYFDYIKKAFYLELAINRPYIFGGRYTVLYGKFFCAQFIVNIGIVLAVVVAHNIRVVALIHSQNPIFMKAFGTGKLRQFKRKPHLFTKDLNLNNSVNLYPV